MWPNWLQNWRGSTLDSQRENRLLREQNDLLRLLLQQQGVTGLPPAPRNANVAVRQRTAADITRVTRTTLRDQQDKRHEAERLRALNDVLQSNSTEPNSRGSGGTTEPETS